FGDRRQRARAWPARRRAAARYLRVTQSPAGTPTPRSLAYCHARGLRHPAGESHFNGEVESMEFKPFPITAESCVVRATDARKGRSRSVAPGTTAARNLYYGRIILDAGADSEPVRFTTG